MRRFIATVLAVWSLAGLRVWAEPFSALVGNVPVGPVAKAAQVQVPYIFWGGDYATFYANGGQATKPGSVFARQDLSLKLVPGDDFVQQVRDYQSGKSPFLRGTIGMIGMASELIGSDPRTKGIVVFQMTWSAGDHCVARERLKTLKDLKGATVALQKGGPHESLLDELLKDASLTWADVNVVWAKDLTATPDSPAELFRKNPKLDACFVVTPDMIGLCGSLTGRGTGAEGSVKGARVLASTADRSFSIADVYVCRKDWYDANRDWVTKFAAGYLKACEDLVDFRRKYDDGSDKAPMTAVLQLAQGIYGKELLPTLDNEAYGLLCDCKFAGYPGNLAFFTDPKNLHGFEAMNKATLDLAQTRGYAAVRVALIPSSLDWNSPAFVGYLGKMEGGKQEKFRAEAVQSEIEALNRGQMDERTIYAFDINFKPEQKEFSVEQYGVEFQKVVELADKYGGAVIVIRGHADPTKTLYELVQAGMKKDIIKRTGSEGNFEYYVKGQRLDFNATPRLVEMINQGDFDGAPGANPRETMQAAQNLSFGRAKAVKDAVVKYAAARGAVIDVSQIQPVGAGIREPLIPKPKNQAEAEKNMRVEFRLMRVAAEAQKPSEFNF